MRLVAAQPSDIESEHNTTSGIDCEYNVKTKLITLLVMACLINGTYGQTLACSFTYFTHLLDALIRHTQKL